MGMGASRKRRGKESQGARPDLQQGILAGGDDQAELEDPDVGEEALEQQQVAQEGDQAAQANAQDVLQQPPSPGETAGSGCTLLPTSKGARSRGHTTPQPLNTRPYNLSGAGPGCTCSRKPPCGYPAPQSLPPLVPEGSSCHHSGDLPISSSGTPHYAHRQWPTHTSQCLEKPRALDARTCVLG